MVRLILIALLFIPPLAIFWGIEAAYAMFDRAIQTQNMATPFFGGNINEYLSHWMNMVAMSGNAAVVAWFLVLERAGSGVPQKYRWGLVLAARTVAAIIVAAVAIRCIGIDAKDGEGTTTLVVPLLYGPTLAGSYYTLRVVTGRSRFSSTVIAALAFALGHLVAQLVYEPSETGGPNDWFIIVFPWLALSPLAVWMVRRYHAFAAEDAERHPEVIIRSASAAMTWNIMTILLTCVTAVSLYQYFANPRWWSPTWIALPVDFATYVVLATLYAAGIAVMSQRLAAGATHAMLSISVATLVAMILAFIFGFRRPMLILASGAGIITSARAVVLNARTYLGLRYYAHRGSEWATQKLGRDPVVRLLTYVLIVLGVAGSSFWFDQ